MLDDLGYEFFREFARYEYCLKAIVLLLICRVRNNLFHGGKFNGRWFEPQRSEELMRYALIILRACGQSHDKVSNAYAGNVF